jgi:FkbM family methyltransferase
MKSILKSLVYGAVDLATARRGITRVVGGERLRFSPRWCRYYPANYEPATFAFIRTHCKPGQTVFDIGAHFGLFTVVMARLVGPTGQVFSFEPTALTRKVLRRTVRINGCTTVVQVRPEAVAQRTGDAMFYDTGDPGSNANSLVSTLRRHLRTTVPTVSLDDFVGARGIKVDALKIDVEGAELEVLRGASETFARCRPVAHLSLHPAAIQMAAGSLAGVWELLQRYRMSVTRGVIPVAEAEFCQAQDLFDVQILPC